MQIIDDSFGLSTDEIPVKSLHVGLTALSALRLSAAFFLQKSI